jgi:predicted nucleic acid-binding protein
VVRAALIRLGNCNPPVAGIRRPSAIKRSRAARALVSQVDLIPLTIGLLDVAADVGEPALRSLDAIHLVSALSIAGELTAFVAYNNRLVTAALAAELDVRRPGAGTAD